MRRAIASIAAVVVLCSVPSFAHHAAEGMVDAEVYEMIDTLVQDTPHATWEPPVEVDDGMYEATLTTKTSRQLESMIDDGLLDYLAMLDGVVLIEMTFVTQRGGVELLITQWTDE